MSTLYRLLFFPQKNKMLPGSCSRDALTLTSCCSASPTTTVIQSKPPILHLKLPAGAQLCLPSRCKSNSNQSKSPLQRILHLSWTECLTILTNFLPNVDPFCMWIHAHADFVMCMYRMYVSHVTASAWPSLIRMHRNQLKPIGFQMNPCHRFEHSLT